MLPGHDGSRLLIASGPSGESSVKIQARDTVDTSDAEQIWLESTNTECNEVKFQLSNKYTKIEAQQ